MSPSGSGPYPSLQFDAVPQLQNVTGQSRRLLTSSQHSELEMARKRAEKAAEGKRANAEAAKQRFKRKKGERAEAARLEMEEARQGNEELEHKLSVVEDQKEAKRLKRSVTLQHLCMEIYSCKSSNSGVLITDAVWVHVHANTTCIHALIAGCCAIVCQPSRHVSVRSHT